MQIIPAAIPAAEGVKMAAPSPQTTGNTAFEMVLAASHLKLSAALAPQGESPFDPGLLGGMLGGLFHGLKPEADGEGQLLIDGEPAEEPPAEEPEEVELDYSLAAMAAPIIPTDTQTQPTQESRTNDPVAHILEGNTPNKDIDDLAALAEGPKAQQEAEPQTREAAFVQEVMARMPEQSPTVERPVAPAAQDGGSCPLENMNDPAGPAELAESQQAAPQETDQTIALPAAQTADEIVKPQAGEARPEIQVTGPEQAAEAPRPAPAPDEADLSGEEAREETTGKQDSAGQADTTQAAVAARPMDIGALRAQGELQMQRPTQTATATSETLMDTMVQEISLSQQDSRHQVEIQLRPDYLGKVSVQLTLDEHGLQAKIRAEDPTVRGLIGSQVNQLIESLAQKGIRLTEVDVTYQAAQTQDFSQSSGGREQMSQEGRNRSLPAQALEKAEAPADFEALRMDTYVSTLAEPGTAAYRP